MADLFQDTPVTLLSRLEKREEGPGHQKAWRVFFDLYHRPVRIAVVTILERHQQSDETLIDDVVADVFVAFAKAKFSYDPDRGKFRNYLWQLITWKAMRALRNLNHHFREVEPLLLADLVDPNAPMPDANLTLPEMAACRVALLCSLMEDVRSQVGPQTFLIFELTKLKGVPPEDVALELGVKRNVVDNAVRRIMLKLKELALKPEYQREYHENQLG